MTNIDQGGELTIFVGDDWAEDHHDIHLMDADGARLAARRLPEGLAGIRGFHELVAGYAEEPGQVVIGIETDRGLWVEALAAAGYEVFAVNPLAVARYRDRHQVSGAKSDAGDAKLLADLVRTDRHNHRPIAGDTPTVEAIKVLARGHQNLIWARTRHTNALRSSLREYYPAALEVFDDLADRDALAVLGRAPTPIEGAHLSLAKIRAALKHAGANAISMPDPNRFRPHCVPSSSPRQRRLPPRSGRPPAPPWGSSPNSTDKSASSRPAWPSILRHTRTPTSTSPCQDSVSSSAPGCSVSSGTTRTVTPPPSVAKTTPEHHR
ncbi:Conserved protein of unknown function (part1) [Mycobacterium canettii CIPT 140070010]|nr:Conserved protein of unknown function (part1) [Mycobacterium canettii CIPT 140070010]